MRSKWYLSSLVTYRGSQTRRHAISADPASSSWSAGTASTRAGAGCFRRSHKASIDLWSALVYVCVLPPLAVCIVLNAATCHRLPGLRSVTTLPSAFAFPCQQNLLGKIWYLFRNCRQVIRDTLTYGIWYAYPHAGSAVWLAHLTWLVSMLTTSAHRSYDRWRRTWILAIRLSLIVPWTVGLLADFVPIGALAATALLQITLRGDHVSVIWEVYETLAYRLPIKDQILVMSWDALLSITSWILVQPRLPYLQQLAPVIIAPTLVHLVFQKLLSIAVNIPLTLALDRTNHHSCLHISRRTAKSRHDSMGGQDAVDAAPLASQPGTSLQTVSHTADSTHGVSGSHSPHVSHTARQVKQHTDKPAGATSVVPHLDKDTHVMPGAPSDTQGPQNAHVALQCPQLQMLMHRVPDQQAQLSGSELDLSTAIYGPSRRSAIVSIKVEPPPHMAGSFPQLLAAAELAQAQATADMAMQHEDTDVLSSSQVHIIRGCIQLVAIVERPEEMTDDHFQQLLARYQQHLQSRLLQSLQGSTLLDSSTIDAQSKQADSNAPGWYAVCIPPVPSVPPPAGAYTGNLAVAGLPISKGGAETSMPSSIAELFIWSPQQYAGREELPGTLAARAGKPHADSAAAAPVHLPAVPMSDTAAARLHADLDTVQPSDVDTELLSGSAAAVQTAGTASVQHADTAALPSSDADGTAKGSADVVAHGPVAAMSDAHVPSLCRIVVKQGHLVMYDKQLSVSHTGLPLQVQVSGLQQGAATLFVLPPSSTSVWPPTYSADIYLHAPFIVVPAAVATEMNRLFQQMIQAAKVEVTTGSDIYLKLLQGPLTATAEVSDSQDVPAATATARQPTTLEAKVWTNHMSPLCADISSILELSRTAGQHAATAPADMAAIPASPGAISNATATTASASTAGLSAAPNPTSIGTTGSARSSTDAATAATAATSMASRINAASCSSATRLLQSKAAKVLRFLQLHGMSVTITYILRQLQSAGVDIRGSEFVAASSSEPTERPSASDATPRGMAEIQPLDDSHTAPGPLPTAYGTCATQGVAAMAQQTAGSHRQSKATATLRTQASETGAAAPSACRPAVSTTTAELPALSAISALKQAVTATIWGRFADPQVEMQYQHISKDRHRVADTFTCVIWSAALIAYAVIQPIQALPLVIILSCAYVIPSFLWLQPSFQPRILRRYVRARVHMQYVSAASSAAVRVLAGIGLLQAPLSGIGAYSFFYTFVDPFLRQFQWSRSALPVIICYIAWYMFYRQCAPHSNAQLRAFFNMATYTVMMFSLETWWRWRVLLQLHKRQQHISMRQVTAGKLE